MAFHLFDSLSGTIREFVPRTPGHVSIYVCGPTVQSAPHIGHLRSALIYDQLRRWLAYRGLSVTLIRNVTDIDDKILANATAEESWWALAYRVEREFSESYARLGILPPTYEPHATGHIPEMIELIGRILRAGHAYVANDGSGDVYFDATSWPAYGRLTRQQLSEMEPAADGETRGKRDPRDFALWKGRKPTEPVDASWPSPWGLGRPGWHIECSAMSTRYLGPEFDIHGGGLDLRFPHHENELAQSQAAGDPFARYWMHNGLVAVGDRKMSKSLGNFVLATDLLSQARPLVVRYFLGSAHYRSTIEYDPQRSLTEAEAAVDRIVGFLSRVETRLADTRYREELAPGEVPTAFANAMDDDLGIPTALAVLHDTIRSGNAAIDAEDWHRAAAIYSSVRAMTSVLGIDPSETTATGTGGSTPTGILLDALVSGRLQERERARESRDFSTADRIRDELKAVGIKIDDTADGPHWSIDDE